MGNNYKEILNLARIQNDIAKELNKDKLVAQPTPKFELLEERLLSTKESSEKFYEHICDFAIKGFVSNKYEEYAKLILESNNASLCVKFFRSVPENLHKTDTYKFVEIVSHQGNPKDSCDILEILKERDQLETNLLNFRKLENVIIGNSKPDPYFSCKFVTIAPNLARVEIHKNIIFASKEIDLISNFLKMFNQNPQYIIDAENIIKNLIENNEISDHKKVLDFLKVAKVKSVDFFEDYILNTHNINSIISLAKIPYTNYSKIKMYVENNLPEWQQNKFYTNIGYFKETGKKFNKYNNPAKPSRHSQNPVL
jgi:hypothetical protein